jgi:hypothetical protein
MPFTLSHAAAALPLRRMKLVPSALAVGTFAPDLEYFARLSPSDGYGHTLPGTFLLTLPLALLTLWLFHAFVKGPVVAMLPEGFRRRLSPYLGRFRLGGVARFGWIVLSLLVGIATHLLWDSFTHRNTWLYRRWPLLQEKVTGLPFGSIPVYKILQHGSTLVGMVALALWVVHWYRDTEPAHEPSVGPARMRVVTLAVILLVAVAGAAAWAAFVVGLPTQQISIARFSGVLVVTLIALLWWQFVLWGMVTARRSA